MESSEKIEKILTYLKQNTNAFITALLVSSIIIVLSKCLNSNFINKFLDSNLITLEITIISITFGLSVLFFSYIDSLKGSVNIKLKKIISNSLYGDFEATFASLKTIINEKFSFLIFTIVLLIFKNSESLNEMPFFVHVIDVLLLSTFIIFIYMLREVILSFFAINNYKQEIEKHFIEHENKKMK